MLERQPAREMELHETKMGWYFTIKEVDGQEIYVSETFLTNYAAAQNGMEILNAMHEEHPVRSDYTEMGE